MAKIKVQVKKWYGWKTLVEGVEYEWLSGRTTACGIEYKPAQGEVPGHIIKKIADVSFPLQLSVTLKDGTIEYIPDIITKRIRILEIV